MAHLIAVLGSTGHFGGIIFKHLCENLQGYEFIVLGRHKHNDFPSKYNITTYPYDFKIDAVLPSFHKKPDLLLDLSGPVAEDSPLVFEACLKARIPYMDISLDVNHLNNCQSVYKKYSGKNKSGFALVHTGLFPGFSNLLMADLIKEMPKNSEFILANEFPVYAGGGYKVAQTLANLLENHSTGYYFFAGKKIPHSLHEGPVKIQFKGKSKNFYRWFLPEVTSLEYSLKPENFSRLIFIKPAGLNVIFKFITRMLQNQSGKWIVNLLKWKIYFLKKYVFKIFTPSIRIEAIGIHKKSEKRILLDVANAVPLHGDVMAGFIRAYFNLPNRKKLSGVFTAEQLFSVSDVLAYGDFSEYRLAKEERSNHTAKTKYNPSLTK